MSGDRSAVGYALVVLGSVLFIINAGMSRVAMESGIAPTSLTSIRITGAAIIFGLWVLVSNRQFLRPPRGRELIDIAFLGIFGVLAVQLGYHIALTRLPVGIALILEYLAPVWVVLWVRFARKEPVRNRMWFAVTMAVVGMAVVGQVWEGLIFDLVGVIAGLAAGIAFAIYFVLGESNIKRSDPLFVIFWSFAIAAVLINVLWPVWNVDNWFDTTSMIGPFADIYPPVWLVLLWTCTAGAVLPFFLQLKALHFISPTMVTMVAMLEPIGAIILGWLWFAEVLNFTQLLGALIIIVAIMLAQSARAKHPTEMPVTN